MSEPTVRDRIVSMLLWGAGVSWLVPVMGSMMALQTIVPADRLDWLGRLYSWGQIALTGSRWRAEVGG